MFTFTIDTPIAKIKDFLYDALLKDIEEAHPDEVIVLKGVRKSWKKRYDDNDLVRIQTAHDGQVCKHCRDVEMFNPYRYGDAKKLLPHHPGCRCQIRSLRARDPGYLAQPTLAKFVKYSKLRLGYAKSRKAKGTPQRGVTIKRLRKKGRRFVAPSGYRAIRIKTR